MNKSSNKSNNDKVTMNKTEKSCIICNGTCLSVGVCDKFLNLTHQQRWSAVHEHNLCRKCLTRHKKFGCKSYNNVCGKDQCQYKHHQLLHNDKNKQENASPELVATQLQCNNHQTKKSRILFRIVPVVISSHKARVNTFAFLDDGSSVTLLESDLANELGLIGTPDPLCLKWTGDTHRMEEKSECVSFVISATGSSKKYQIRAHTVNVLDLPTQSISATVLKDKYPHLKNVPLLSYNKAIPRLLIGLDQLNLQLPLNITEGDIDQPVGTKTRLGWTVYGPCSNPEPDVSMNHEFYSFHICNCDPDNELNNILKDYYTLDSSGITRTSKVLESSEDARARAILESTTVKREKQYEVGLLWKYDSFILPDSLPMAKKRFECLEKKLRKSPELAKNLNTQIQQYVVKGYARKLSNEELQHKQSRIWYLPTFPVINHNKPGKIRIVWDAAAKVNGVSLNSMLLKGPDQLASLFSVLLRYRERKIAICADISEMFHQVKINEDDQHCQRFLWTDEVTGNIDTYVMQVMTFGSTCSPSCAQYVMKKNASEFSETYPRAVSSIMHNHYVDDLLDCCDTESEAIELAKNVYEIHKNAGFHIRNWISNSEEVIKSLGESNLDSKKNLNVNTTLEAEKVLGMWWNTKLDTFTYHLSLNNNNSEYLTGNRRPTKREVLRTMMTIFDPLGLIAFFIIYIKILMQDIWKSSIGWDDVITDEQHEKWQTWVQLLAQVEHVEIPRCYLRDFQTYENTIIELHTFADASEEAFASVVYVRIISDDHVQCSLVGAKTRVAPIKTISIPRLELEAAVLAVRLAESIGNAITIPITRRYFWTDSNVVKCWINSDQKKYRQFVSFRIGEILETSNASEWHWLPSKLNVADDATKWQKLPDFSPKSRWFRGPDFLYDINSELLIADVETQQTMEELRPQYIGHINIQHIENLIDVERFSNWIDIRKCVAFCYRFMNNIKAKRSGHPLISGPIRQNEYKKAENMLFRLSQANSYPDEVAMFLKNSNDNDVVLEKSSKLYKHCPYMDTEMVIRASSRLNNATRIPECTKNPILLDGKNYVTKLLINHYHLRYHHKNHETVINELRQVYIIPKLRVALKNVRKDCKVCKIINAKPEFPRMAPLPECRLSSFTRPFTYSGVDYFGPMTVCVGRRTEKRWGMLITCLTVRAIHIEVVHSLSTDSCILGLRNFMARRGTPREIYSDCGTNFKGSESELKSAMQNVDKEKLMEYFESSTTKWVFNPPSAPHMGGSWERLVRSVKATLYQIMPSRNPTDELLISMLTEVENIVNSRPLTYIPIDNENDEALTPNHFLLGSSNGSKPIGLFNDDKMILKKNYLKSQQYACTFWRRWIKEYLPSLTRRTKWFELKRPIKEGDIVIVVDENLPRNVWLKGRIIQTYPGADGQVRKVKVQTKNGIYERPAAKIAVLDVIKEGKSSNVDEVPGGNVTNSSSQK